MKNLRPGTASNFPDTPSGRLPWEVEGLVAGRMGYGVFAGPGTNRKPWQVFRAQLAGSWPWTRPGERQDLGSLASDPVSRTSSFALGDFLS